MPRFVSADDVKVIHADWWDEGETVTIKKLTYGDRQKVGKAAIRMRFDDKGKPLDSELGDVNLVVLEVGIKSWTFTRPDNGKPVPCNRYWYERLSEEDGAFILREINALNPAPAQEDPAAAEEFRGADRDGGSERDGAAA